jgi:hypothetical protein
MRPNAITELEHIVAWYATTVYGRWEGPGQVPFYCDRQQIGHFAVDPAALAAGDDDALFQLFVALAMYQSRRDVDIMAIQRTMARRAATAMVAPDRLRLLVETSRCELLSRASGFDEHCSVRRDLARDRATCDQRPRTPCHVKDATMAIRRMGDMGMIPTSAWLHLRDDGGGLNAQLARVSTGLRDAGTRAEAMVTYLAGFRRVGTKLATMFVSMLATPALAPGYTPWSPFVDGSQLVVVDANVIRVVDALAPRIPKTMRARAAWLRKQAKRIDLRRFRADWPQTSPRLVQQAIYWFRSKSNRSARGDTCARCHLRACPFHDAMPATQRS